MKVYIVWREEYGFTGVSQQGIVSIHKTRKGAEKRVKIVTPDLGRYGNLWIEEIEVEEK